MFEIDQFFFAFFFLYSEKSKRRTRALASTLEPRWNQTFLYSHLRRSELRSRFLEITVWDSDRLDTGRLIGEVFSPSFFFFSTSIRALKMLIELAGHRLLSVVLGLGLFSSCRWGHGPRILFERLADMIPFSLVGGD